MKSLNYTCHPISTSLNQWQGREKGGKKEKNKHSLIVPFQTPKQSTFKCMQSDTFKIIILFFAIVCRALLRHTHWVYYSQFWEHLARLPWVLCKQGGLKPSKWTDHYAQGSAHRGMPLPPYRWVGTTEPWSLCSALVLGTLEPSTDLVITQD